MAEYCADSGSEKHDEHDNVRKLLKIHDVQFFSAWSDDGCQSAKEHYYGQQGCNAYKICLSFLPHGMSIVLYPTNVGNYK